jgi:hypothetical protein
MKKRSLKRKLRKQIQRLRSLVSPQPNQTFSQRVYGIIVLLSLVLTRRIKVANLIYQLTDTEVLAAGRRFHLNMDGNSYFGTPPSLMALSDILDEFELLISEAASRDTVKVELRNAKREQVMNMLALFANYVEDVANDPVNAEDGPVAVIESAGMRARVFTSRGKQFWDVFRGKDSGSISMTAESFQGAVHFWAYTTTPTDESSWISIIPTKKAKATITALMPGIWLYCRHQYLLNGVMSPWEGHDPVLVV